MNKLSAINLTIFEQIKQLDNLGNEWWSARDMAKVLEYSEFRHFKPVIEKAKEACKNSGHIIVDHFEDFLGMIETGKGAKREFENIKLSRYACYLIVQNADSTNLYCLPDYLYKLLPVWRPAFLLNVFE